MSEAALQTAKQNTWDIVTANIWHYIKAFLTNETEINTDTTNCKSFERSYYCHHDNPSISCQTGLDR
jgi:hypothetical protein